MILFLYGSDTFRSRAQMHKMIDKFKADRDPQGLNVARLNAADEAPGRILEEIGAAPFLAEKRMVVIERILESKHTELHTELLNRIKAGKILEDTVLLFWEEGGAPKKKEPKALFSALAKEKFAQEFEPLTGVKLTAWISSRLAELGASAESKAVVYLAQNIGADMWRLNSVLEQLTAYASGRAESLGADKSGADKSGADKSGEESSGANNDSTKPNGDNAATPSTQQTPIIQEKDIALFIDKKIDDNIFNLVDAIVARNSRGVFAMIQEQYRTGKDATYVLAMLIRQFRILVQLRDLFDRDELQNSAAVAQRLSLHPFVVKKSLPAVKRYTMRDLERVYEHLLELDIQTKTGQGNQELLLDLLVGRLCVL